MQSTQGTIQDSPHGDEAPQVQAEFSAVQFDERLLPIYEENLRHKMKLEQQQQADNTRITLQLISDTSLITKRGQVIGGGIAVIALIGGLILVAIDKEAVGAAVLILDAVFVFSQKLVKPGQPVIAPESE